MTHELRTLQKSEAWARHRTPRRGADSASAYAHPRLGGRPRIGTHVVGAETKPEQARVREREQARVGQGQLAECPGAGCHLRRLQVAPCRVPRHPCHGRTRRCRELPSGSPSACPRLTPAALPHAASRSSSLTSPIATFQMLPNSPRCWLRCCLFWTPAYTRPRRWRVRAVRPRTVRSHACARLLARRCSRCRWRIPSTSSLRS